MAQAKYFTAFFSDTNVINDILTLPIPPIPTPVTNVLGCFINYNVTPAMEIQNIPITRVTATEVIINMPTNIVGTLHKAIILYT